MWLLPQLATPSWTGPNGFHCQVVIKVLPAPSHVSFLLSCILESWESTHTPLLSVGQGGSAQNRLWETLDWMSTSPWPGTHWGTEDFAGLTHWLNHAQAREVKPCLLLFYFYFYFVTRNLLSSPAVKHLSSLKVSYSPINEVRRILIVGYFIPGSLI